MDTIRNQTFTIEKEDLYEEASKLFAAMGMLDPDGPDDDPLKEMSVRIYHVIEDRVQVKGILSYYPDIQLQGNELTVGDTVITCHGFGQVKQEQVKGVFIYFLQAGEFYLESEDYLEQLLADMWGTAFTDAARKELHKRLSMTTRLSEEFGPGFFGMDMLQMQKLSQLADAALAGIQIKDSGLLLPLKSLGCLYFDVTEDYEELHAACRDCKGTVKSCSFCNVMRRG